MSFLDFSDAGSQGGGVRGIIPEGSLAWGRFKVKPYNAENNVLSKLSSTGNKSMEVEFEIVHPDAYLGCKVWEYYTIEGKEVAVNIARAAIKAMCEVTGASPGNPSGYQLPMMPNKDPDLRKFDGQVFPLQIGVEKGEGINPKNGKPYGDKNRVRKILTPLDETCRALTERLNSPDYDPPALLPIEDKPAAAPASAPGNNPFAGRTPPPMSASTPAPATPPMAPPAAPPPAASGPATPPWLVKRA